MSLAEFVFVTSLVAIPALLLLRAWQRYLGTGADPSKQLLELKVALGLISASTFAWLAVLALMMLENRSPQAKAIAKNVSPVALGLANLALCASALVFSRIRRKSAPGLGPLRLAIGLSSACLIVIWLFLASNPH